MHQNYFQLLSFLIQWVLNEVPERLIITAFSTCSYVK